MSYAHTSKAKFYFFGTETPDRKEKIGRYCVVCDVAAYPRGVWVERSNLSGGTKRPYVCAPCCNALYQAVGHCAA